MNLFDIIVLALIQGITEFLPISSSGHLALWPILTGRPDQGVAMDVAVHMGTLAAVCVFFRQDAGRLLAQELLAESAGGAFADLEREYALAQSALSARKAMSKPKAMSEPKSPEEQMPSQKGQSLLSKKLELEEPRVCLDPPSGDVYYMGNRALREKGQALLDCVVIPRPAE